MHVLLSLLYNIVSMSKRKINSVGECKVSGISLNYFQATKSLASGKCHQNLKPYNDVLEMDVLLTSLLAINSVYTDQEAYPVNTRDCF